MKPNPVSLPYENHQQYRLLANGSHIAFFEYVSGNPDRAVYVFSFLNM